MDINYLFKNNGLLKLQQLLLLLLLTGFQQMVSTSDDNQSEEEGLDVAIVGPDYVTVGVPSSVECVSECSSCTYSMSLDGQAAQGQGNVLAFTVKTWTEELTVSCSVTDKTGSGFTATKNLQVLVGPVNISITGTEQLNPSVSYTYSCQAYCQPSCSYSWKIDHGPWMSGQGNVMSVTPTEMDESKILICKATNTVSGMFIAATRNISVMVGPADVQIKGPDVIEVAEKSKFVCSAVCLPSCRYVFSVDSRTVRGNVVELTVEHPLKSVTIKCEAQNTATRKSATAIKTVQIRGSDRSATTRPEETSALVLLLVILSTFSTL